MPTHRGWSGRIAALVLSGTVTASGALAAEHARSDIYGYVMTDAGYNNKGIDPQWFDVQRPSKLASSQAVQDQLGKDGSTFFSVRQTRFGIKSWVPTDMGELKTTFEFELFGTGVDAGQTTFRLRHAYGELGKWGAGQTWSPFMDIYGYVMTDAGYNNKGIDPQWFDVQRPSKLASSKAVQDQFGKDGSTFFSVRQTRFGIKSWVPTDMGELKTTFEFELFGTGVDAGQTTFRLRHAYGELGKWGAGQTWSPFMDIDVFPNTLEYWGPNGMVFFRNVQLRYMPIQGDTRMTIALERPGASADQGIYAGKIDLTGVVPRFPLPDLSAEYRRAISKGYVEVAGIVRQIKWEDNVPTPTDISGDVVGWGVNLSSNLKAGEGNVLRLQFVYGEGIENYMNDAPADVGAKPNPGNATKPIKGEALPVTGVVAFLDHTWNKKYTSSIGYSDCTIDNSAGQTAGAFHNGQYALVNLLCTPVPNVMAGVEAGWIHRQNNADGFTVDDYHVQVSAKYNFSFTPGGGK